jgi:hypothetical protein
VRAEDGRDTFLRVYEGRPELGDVVQRYDPILDRAIDLARGLGLVEWTSSSRIRLRPAGNDVISILRAHDLLTDVVTFLDAIPDKFSQSRLNDMVQVWR